MWFGALHIKPRLCSVAPIVWACQLLSPKIREPPLLSLVLASGPPACEPHNSSGDSAVRAHLARHLVPSPCHLAHGELEARGFGGVTRHPKWTPICLNGHPELVPQQSFSCSDLGRRGARPGDMSSGSALPSEFTCHGSLGEPPPTWKPSLNGARSSFLDCASGGAARIGVVRVLSPYRR